MFKASVLKFKSNHYSSQIFYMMSLEKNFKIKKRSESSVCLRKHVMISKNYVEGSRGHFNVEKIMEVSACF